MRLYEQLFVPGNTLRERYGRYTIARSLEFLRRQEGGSWFTWIHLFDPHAPYEVSEEQLAVAPRQGEPLDLPEYWPPPYRSVTDIDWILKTYHQELELTDSLVGQVFDHLRATGEWENTMVIVTADHGESLTEHDYLFDHGDYLYDASLRIPLIIKHPGLSPKEPRTECQVSAADILPTVVEWLDLPVGGETGTSFAPQLRGDPCRSEPVLSSTIAGRYMERPPVDRSLRSPESKYIYHEDGGHEL